MGRFTETETIVRYKEAVAPRVEIDWNPVTNAATIYFSVQMAVYEGGQFASMSDDPTLEMSRLKVNFASIAGRTFNVPIGGGNFAAIPAMLLMGAIKQVFDELYSEHRAAYDAPVVSATPTPTPSPSSTPMPSASPPPSASDTPTPTPTPSLSGSPTPTPTPSATTTPVPSPTPTPTPTPSA